VISFAAPDGRQLGALDVAGPGEPVICLPGGPLRDPRYFGDLGRLAAHRRLAVLQLAHRPVAELVADVEALRSHLGLDRADLLAHSAGGNLALLYAAAHPDRVRRLVLVTPGTRVIGIEGSEARFQAALSRRAAEPWYPAAMAAVERWFAGEATPEVEAQAAPFFYGRWDASAEQHAASERQQMPADAEAIYYGGTLADPAATRAALAELPASVLVLAGEYDPSPDRQTAEELTGLLPDARLEVQPGAGHFPWLDDPDRFSATVAGFLSH
jgi:pimeloyl-ACP methyl ester carboxylesterase